jgi:hypothetical protein
MNSIITRAGFVPHIGVSIATIVASTVVGAIMLAASPDPIIAANARCTHGSITADNEHATITLRCDINGATGDAILTTERARTVMWYLDNRDRVLTCSIREGNRIAGCMVP